MITVVVYREDQLIFSIRGESSAEYALLDLLVVNKLEPKLRIGEYGSPHEVSIVVPITQPGR